MTRRSLLIAGAEFPLVAARRPRYGGTLRIGVSADALASIESLVFETLVRFDDKGRPQPWLASGWQVDARHLVFRARRGVVFQDGSRWEPPGGVIAVPASRQPLDAMLREYARPQNAIAVKAGDGSRVGTGPFRVESLDASRRALLLAHEDHWAGRPFLDAIDWTLGRQWREQSLDFETGKLDAIETPATEAKRAAQRGWPMAASLPADTYLLAVDKDDKDDTLARALAAAIDRGSIHTVLLQRQGEVSAALLPQWLSGYSFVFPAGRGKAVAGFAAQPAFGYDGQDPVARLVADRIAVNAREAGIVFKSAAPNAAADVRLVRRRVTETDPLLALGREGGTPFETERDMMRANRLIPLFHLPVQYAVAKRVQGWVGAPWMRFGKLRLEDVWLDG